MSILTLGGILLLLGSFFIYKGNIYFSTITYTLADLCWVSNAYTHNDIFGVLSISVGIIVGLIVMYKMNTGIFVKRLNKEK